MVALKFILYLILGVGSVFLILLVLIQKGRGGGLAGALGGMGGSSAFGARAGDTFTRITIGAAAVWILCAMLLAGIRANEGPAYTDGVEKTLSSGESDEADGGLGGDGKGTSTEGDEGKGSSEKTGTEKGTVDESNTLVPPTLDGDPQTTPPTKGE